MTTTMPNMRARATIQLSETSTSKSALASRHTHRVTLAQIRTPNGSHRRRRRRQAIVGMAPAASWRKATHLRAHTMFAHRKSSTTLCARCVRGAYNCHSCACALVRQTTSRTKARDDNKGPRAQTLLALPFTAADTSGKSRPMGSRYSQRQQQQQHRRATVERTRTILHKRIGAASGLRARARATNASINEP